MFNTMKRTARQSSTKTLTDLLRAMDGQYAVTMTYTDADGEETVRTIEVHDVLTTREGRIIIRTMDRLRDERRDFRTERIAAYTVHRSRHVMTPPAAKTPVLRSAAQLIALELGRDDWSPKRIALAA
ncbi:WYL domain-containing protein [Streptomyces sp. NPDC021100]|uniref:WYL domain-containing protein n=1 Tax=Streptomyces sp. NPDC021100 TaxID=3365114 RepID=UPI00379127AC